MSLLQQKVLRPLRYQEALVKIDQNPELKRQLKGKRFYLDGKGLQLLGNLSGNYAFNDRGEMTWKSGYEEKTGALKMQGKEDIEKTVHVWKGPQPLLLDVQDDYETSLARKRFYIDANIHPAYIAEVVVGVRI